MPHNQHIYVSIITVCFNARQYIETTVQSVLMQSYPYIEYIIIDGGSTDGTLEVIQQYQQKLSYWVSEPDKGLYYAINKGLEQANGQIIGLLHAGDVLHQTDTIAKIAERWQHETPDLLYADLLYVAESNLNKVIRYWKSGKWSVANMYCGWMPPHPTVYVSAKIVSQVGIYNTNYRIAADYEWMLRVMKHTNRISYLPEVTVRMRVGGLSNQSAASIQQKSLEDLKAIRQHKLWAWFTLLCKNIRKLNQFLHRFSAGNHFTA